MCHKILPHLLHFLIAAALVAGCTPAPTPQTASPAAVTSTPSALPLVEASATMTAQPLPTRPTKPVMPTADPATKTAAPTQPTRTPSPTPSITPTFDVASIVTHTPVPAAQCPAEAPELVPVFDEVIGTSETVRKFFQQVLEFLNAGGTRQAVIVAYRLQNPRADERTIREQDVTADGVLDLLITERGSLAAFVCQDGEYQEKIMIGETSHSRQPVIVTIQEMTGNGVDEVVSMNGDLRFRRVDIFEWNGVEFRPLNWNTGCADLMGESVVFLRDTDNNSLLELVLEQGIPIWSEYVMGMPWREETRTCSWNGESFVLTHTVYSPSEYRFQAVQDGDRATLAGDYDTALDLYQQAVFSDQLEWWSFDRRMFELELVGLNMDSQPTPEFTLQPDPAEYPSLAAYARFRILLLHVLRGYLPEAQTIYDTLQEKFPPGQSGHAHAVMAAAFWEEYQVSQRIDRACEQAVAYAAAHPAEVLAYVGNTEYSDTYFGNQSLSYKPEDVCPFRTGP